MPGIDDVSYSRDECVAAVRDYYRFLTTMYLDESEVVEPPEGGWPGIASVDGFEKTDEVLSLLRRLPYIRQRYDGNDAQGAPRCHFADWREAFHGLGVGKDDGEGMKVCSEGGCIYEDVPPHVVGLTMGGRDNEVFLLDTELGIVHWINCPSEIYHGTSQERIYHDWYDEAPEAEADWRGDSTVWTVADFFELLKDQFRALNFVPLNSRSVKDVWFSPFYEDKETMPILQDIYLQHGWPDLELYNKKECLQAVHAALKERFPDEC